MQANILLLSILITCLVVGVKKDSIKKFVKGLVGRKKPKEKMRVNSTGKLVYFRDFIEDEIYNENSNPTV